VPEASVSATEVSATEWDAWRSFITMRNNLDRALEKRLQQESGLSAPDYEILITLFESPLKQLRAREFATTIGWEKSRLSHQVTRMEKRGLVERRECDTDGRGTWIALTPSGSRAVLSAMRDHSTAIRHYFFDVVTPEELSVIEAASQRVIQTIDPPECDEEE